MIIQVKLIRVIYYLMGKEKSYFQILKKNVIIKENGKMGIIKVKELQNGGMDQNIKENLLMGRNKDMEFILFLMEIIMKDLGLMENNKDKEQFIERIDK